MSTSRIVTSSMRTITLLQDELYVLTNWQLRVDSPCPPRKGLGLENQTQQEKHRLQVADYAFARLNRLLPFSFRSKTHFSRA